MKSLTLIRPVLVKVKVTENYKKVASAELQEAIRRVELELQHLDFQAKRINNSKGVSPAGPKLEQERQRRVESRRKLIEQLKEIAQLNIGAEVVYGRMESPVELKVGDKWRDIVGVEIVLQDGIIAAVRHSGAGGDHGDD